jgi:hypothetical protein
VLHWVGLPELHDGGRQWMDLAAMEVDAALPMRRQLAMEPVS